MDEKKSEYPLPVLAGMSESSKPRVGYTVGFTIAGPEGTYSSVKVEASFSRHKSAEDDDSDVFGEAMARAISKLPAGYEALLKAIEQVREKYGM